MSASGRVNHVFDLIKNTSIMTNRNSRLKFSGDAQSIVQRKTNKSRCMAYNQKISVLQINTIKVSFDMFGGILESDINAAPSMEQRSSSWVMVLPCGQVILHRFIGNSDRDSFFTFWTLPNVGSWWQNYVSRWVVFWGFAGFWR